jgi:hypothetical protein
MFKFSLLPNFIFPRLPKAVIRTTSRGNIGRPIPAFAKFVYPFRQQIHLTCSVKNGYNKTNKLRGLSPQANYTATSDRSLSAKLVPTLADGGCRVVSTTDPHGRIPGFF